MSFFHDVVLTYDGDDCLAWPYAQDGKGYGYLWVDSSLKYVHRLVCEFVNGPPPSGGYEAAHDCGKGHLACVTKRHLFWKTRAENRDDMLVHGTVAKGEKVGTAKLTEEQAAMIKRSIHLDAKAIAAEMGVSRVTVYSIRRGENWGWLNV